MEQTMWNAIIDPDFLRGVLTLAVLMAGSWALRRVLYVASGYKAANPRR